ncbi:ATPase [Helicobacter pylori]
MNYPNPPIPEITTKEKPAFKEITSELLRELESALNNATLWEEQVELSLKGIVRILEVLLSLDFFKNANEIDSSLRNSIEWLNNAGESLKLKMKEYEGFFSDFNASMKSNEQEVTAILNANTENIKNEIKKLENQLIETTTKLLTSYQIFLNQAIENATTQINADKTQALTNINEAKTNANNEINTNQTQAINNINEVKENATNQITENKTASLEAIAQARDNATTQINTNKTASLEAIKGEKNQATSEIIEAKKTIIIKTLIFLRLNKAC